MNNQRYSYDLLYVEDENITRKNYAEYLEFYFQRVYQASNAEEAYRLYKSKRPAILIIDINLPKENGIELLRKIRENDHGVKAIMLTARSDVATLMDATELKLTRYLCKPVSRDELLGALELAIEEIMKFTTISKKIIQLKESYSWDNENMVLLFENEEQRLTKKEIEFLTLLFSNTEKIFSRDEIIYELWYDSDSPKEDSLKTIVKGLRRKLPKDTIKNIFGIGYKIEV